MNEKDPLSAQETKLNTIISWLASQMKKKNQKISLGLSCLSECSICFLFFPFMELVVRAVDFVDLSPIEVKQLGLEISKNVFSLSKIKV